MATKKKSKKVIKSKATKKVKAVKRAAPKKKARSAAKPVAKKRVKLVAAKAASQEKAPAKKTTKRRVRGKADVVDLVTYENSGLGAGTGGQSGDTQGLSGVAETDSESVKELLEEGQSFEAEILEGVENVPDADEGK